jgi:hypothetical protein
VLDQDALDEIVQKHNISGLVKLVALKPRIGYPVHDGLGRAEWSQIGSFPELSKGRMDLNIGQQTRRIGIPGSQGAGIVSESRQYGEKNESSRQRSKDIIEEIRCRSGLELINTPARRFVGGRLRTRRLGERLLQRGDDGRWIVGVVRDVICGRRSATNLADERRRTVAVHPFPCIRLMNPINQDQSFPLTNQLSNCAIQILRLAQHDSPRLVTPRLCSRLLKARRKLVLGRNHGEDDDFPIPDFVLANDEAV